MVGGIKRFVLSPSNFPRVFPRTIAFSSVLPTISPCSTKSTKSTAEIIFLAAPRMSSKNAAFAEIRNQNLREKVF